MRPKFFKKHGGVCINGTLTSQERTNQMQGKPSGVGGESRDNTKGGLVREIMSDTLFSGKPN